MALIRNALLWIGLCITFASQAKVRLLGFDPINQLLIIRNFYVDSVDLSKYYLAYGDTVHSLAGLRIESGALHTPGKTNVIFSGLPINFDSGYLALIDLRYVKTMDHPQAIADYVAWGKSGYPWEYKADSAGYWSMGNYLKSNPPFQYLGNSADRGLQFWQSFKAPQLSIRLVKVNLRQESFVLKNTGGSNVNISKLRICIHGICYDSIAGIPGMKYQKNLDIPKNDSVRIICPGLIHDSIGDIALFLPVSRIDTVSIIDYVKWGADTVDLYAEIAASKKIWDTSKYISCTLNDSLRYFGDFSKLAIGPQWWKIDTTYEVPNSMEAVNSKSLKVIYLMQGWEISGEPGEYFLINIEGQIIQSFLLDDRPYWVSRLNLPRGMYIVQKSTSKEALKIFNSSY